VPIGRPRRIFRSGFSNLPPVDSRALATVLLGAVLIGGGYAAISWLRDGAVTTPQAATPQQELVAPAAQVAVVDGGTLRLNDRVVRLSGVTPPTRGTTCGTGEDCAAASANALAALVHEDPVACRVTGRDGLGRAFAVCETSGTELNQAVVAAGWARADDHQPALRQAEATARAERRGVWALIHGATW
jgi:endonuclease YncB( thermonuclease family)